MNIPARQTVQADAASKPVKIRKRDAARTQAEILAVAVNEFAEHGFHGARITRITKAAKCNSRMIYHYFGSKEQLYTAALGSVFEDIRNQEADLNLGEGDPVEKVTELVEFTFDYFANNASFRKLTRNENLLNGEYITRSSEIRDISRSLIKSIEDLIDRGISCGSFSRKPDAVQFYLTIVALSAHHLNNGATLGVVVGQDLFDRDWQAQRRAHSIDVMLGSLGVSNQ